MAQKSVKASSCNLRWEYTPGQILHAIPCKLYRSLERVWIVAAVYNRYYLIASCSMGLTLVHSLVNYLTIQLPFVHNVSLLNTTCLLKLTFLMGWCKWRSRIGIDHISSHMNSTKIVSHTNQPWLLHAYSKNVTSKVYFTLFSFSSSLKQVHFACFWLCRSMHGK